MPVVKVTPTKEYPVPYDATDEEAESFADELTLTASTAELLEELGAPIEMTTATLASEKHLLKAALKDKSVAKLNTSLPAALGAAEFLRAYGTSQGHDLARVRTALTNKLLEIAACGEIKYELKAIELLGKHSDVGLFTERSEINVTYKDATSLEEAIKQRVKRLLGADVVDIKPLGMDLADELGIFDEVDFEEVEEAPAPAPAPEEEEPECDDDAG